MALYEGKNFWAEAFSLQGSILPKILIHVLAFGGISLVIWGISLITEAAYGYRLSLEVTPFEFAGAVLGLLMVLRTNTGYDRWWEARRLWGGIVNQSRNVVISSLAYGPHDEKWRSAMVKWGACFPHIARASLRGEGPPDEVRKLLGDKHTEALAQCNHMPSYVAFQMARLLEQACQELGMDRFAFLQIDRERANLIDHIGGCERILKTPLPMVYAITIRRFIALYLISLPFALLHYIEDDWLMPIVTMLVAYPLISLDQIGVELQNPFAKAHINHLPLSTISNTIEGNVTFLLSHVDEILSPSVELT